MPRLGWLYPHFAMNPVEKKDTHGILPMRWFPHVCWVLNTINQFEISTSFTTHMLHVWHIYSTNICPKNHPNVGT